MSDIATFAPIKVTIEFVFANGDQVASAQFDCPAGQLPTPEQVAQAAVHVRNQVRESAGDEFDWQDRDDFIQDLFEERTGQRGFAIPGKNEWQANWAKGGSQ